MSNEPLNVSLEPHLVETLTHVLPLLPDTLSSEARMALAAARAPAKEPVEDTPTDVYDGPLVSYSLLRGIARWAYSSEGQTTLQAHNLSPSVYSMVALLAGTRTSPERRYPAPDPPTPSRDINDRRAITALLNALLSILGSGVAVWWAADRLRWKEEWKVLLALFAAIVVASAEAVLFLIWSSRQRPSRVSSKPKRAIRHRARDKSTAEISQPTTEMDIGDEKHVVAATSFDITSSSSNLEEFRTVASLRERNKPSQPAAARS